MALLPIAFVVCERVIVDAMTGGQKSLMGLVHRFVAPQFPIHPPPFTAYAIFTGVTHPTQITIRVVRDSEEEVGEDVLRATTAAVPVSPDGIMPSEIVCQFPQFAFPSPGIYRVQVLHDQLDIQMSWRIVAVQQ